MRILVLTADYAPGSWSGIGVAVARQAEALAALGAEVRVLVGGERWRRECGVEPRTRCGQVMVSALDGDHFPVEPGEFDWIHVHSLALTELVLELRRRCSVPLAYTVHTQPAMELQSGALASFWDTAQRKLFSITDRVVFLSSSERESAAQRWSGDRAGWRVVGNGVPAAPRATRAWSAGGPLVFAGRFASSKGLDLLDSTLEELAKRRAFEVVLAGGHGDAQGDRAVERIAARMGGRARLMGWVSRPSVDALFESAALVLAPSEYEPFGLVALEAMRMGAPVLAADTGGLSEIAAPGSGGELIASREPVVWADRIDQMLAQPERRRRLSCRGPNYTDLHFNSEAIAKKLLENVYC